MIPASQPNLEPSGRLPENHPHKGVTEIVLPATPGSEFDFVLPMLAHLSQQCTDRWLTWIAPRGINRQLLVQYGFALDKVRFIYTHNDQETRWLYWEALAMGNSQTVVASCESLSEREANALEQAALKGNAQGVLLRYRQSNW